MAVFEEGRDPLLMLIRTIPQKHQPLVEQVLLNMALMNLLPPTANKQCLDRVEKTIVEFDAWLKENG